MRVDISEYARHHSITMLDTFAIFEMLHAAGFSPKQAQAITRAIARSKSATSELATKRVIEQHGASTALAVTQCAGRLNESIRLSARDMIIWFVGGQIVLLLALIALVDFSRL